METCSFCKQPKSNKLSKSCHERLCRFNPNKVEHPRNNLGKPGRNQYTRETNPQKTVSEETRIKFSQKASGQTHSLKTREKISASMKKYFEEHPEKVYYRSNHYANGPSYAEKYWAEILEGAGIAFQAEMRVGRFRLDFALTESRIDLEVDGAQHYFSEEAVMRDKDRDLFLESQGWKVIRIRWSEFKKLRGEIKDRFIEGILSQISSSSAPIS
jgi:very-short-patch-repair endonuclease